MPLYEYECQQCKRRTEKILKFSDPPLTVCPHCGGPLEQMIHAPAISFKGGGWYADLYSSGKPKSSGETKSEGGSATADSSAGGAAKDTAPAATPAPSAPAAPAASTGSDKK